MEPKIAKKGLYPVQLEAGTEYHWCACGHSKTQPFCDGSHTTTAMLSLAFTPEKTGRHTLCGCKHTKKPPFCDFSHTEL